MPDKQSGSGFVGNWPLLLVAVLFGTYLANRPDVPILGSRPPAAVHAPTGSERLQDIDARLWQDPIGAVWRDQAQNTFEIPFRDCASKEALPDDGESYAHSCPPGIGNGEVVLGVMLPGAPFPEAEETRRQIRYAVLSALHVKDYVPTDEEHIGYFRQRIDEAGASGPAMPVQAAAAAPAQTAAARGGSSPPKPRERRPTSGRVAAAASGPTRGGHPGRSDSQPSASSGWGRSWLDTPFEEFVEANHATGVLVLWINQDELQKATGGWPISGIRALKAALGVDVKSGSMVVLGPWGSSTLKGMVDEATQYRKCNYVLAASKTEQKPKDFTLYNFSATADDTLLIPAGCQLAYKDLKPTPLAVYFNDRNIEYHRTIGSDSAVISLISDELRKRGVKPGPGSRDHVLLISEWDSYYGRSLPKSMAQPLGAPDCAILSPARNRPLYCVTYMRGLDGQLPETPSAEKQNSPANGGEKSTSGDNRVDEPLARLQISKNIERPYGNGQYDYLRRLGQSIRRFDDDLSARGNGRIRAIGVVGSDVYDKLAALQILRPLFPDTVFFTTDLDARLYHPAELGWSRNLLVASAYGLELSPEWQHQIPPFRVSYQTSAFLATQVIFNRLPASKGANAVLASNANPVPVSNGATAALPSNGANAGPASNAVQALLVSSNGEEARPVSSNGKQARPVSSNRAPDQPVPTLLYEIGVHSPFAFRLETQANAPNPCGDDCNVHAPFQALYPRLPGVSQPVAFIAWSAALGAFLLGVSELFRRWLRVNFFAPAGSTPSATGTPGVLLRFGPVPPVVLFFALGAGFCAAWQPVANTLTASGRGEPFLLVSGISIWPIVLMRLFITGTAILLVIRGLRLLDANFKTIEDKFVRDPARGQAAQAPNAPHNSNHKRHKTIAARFAAFCRRIARDIVKVVTPTGFGHLVSSFSYRVCDPNSNHTPLRIADFWESYSHKVRKPIRLCRVTVAMLLVLFLQMLLAVIFGSPEPTTRSLALRGFDHALLWLESAATWFLILFVADATLFCVRFVKEIKCVKSEWPPWTLEKYQKEMNVNRAFLDQWVDLQFIAKRTACVGGVVYYPFIILALLIISRSSVFDLSPPNVPMLIMMVLGFAVVISCAIGLSWSASDAREIAREEMLAHVVAMKGGGLATPAAPRAKPDQLEMVIRKIDDLREGAFTPFTEQPVIKALLWPLGGIGSAALLNLFLIPSVPL